MRELVAALLLALCCGPTAVWAQEESEAKTDESEAVVAEGSVVSIEYTLKLADGSTADTNVGKEPLVYTQGQSQILPALEEELDGLSVGDTRDVTLEPEDGYGVVRDELFHEVPAESIPEDAREAGAALVAQGPDGSQRMVRVHEVKDDKIVVNLNHPLAGQQLAFSVKILKIE